MTSDLQKAADATAKLLTELQEGNERLRTANTDLQNQVSNLDTCFTRLQEAAGRALAERDYYMRECSELEGKFTSFCSIATEALNTHRMAPFRPNGAAPKDEPANDEGMKAIAMVNGMNDAIPEFLTKAMVPVKIEGPLKLRRKV